jgi:hypothetical protein
VTIAHPDILDENGAHEKRDAEADTRDAEEALGLLYGEA